VRCARAAVRSLAPAVALVALGLGASGHAEAAGGLDLSAPPVRRAAHAPLGAPWTDAGGADHLARDAERRARERAGAPPAAASTPSPISASPAAPVPADPATEDEIRRRGERERDARQGRGSTLPAPMVVPRIQPDAPTAVPVAPLPRIAIPGPGTPGGPPIALPSCGPAGCFDANGRPMPRVGGTDVLIGPGGRPCLQIGGAAGC
jgi:hypothetical protein